MGDGEDQVRCRDITILNPSNLAGHVKENTRLNVNCKQSYNKNKANAGDGTNLTSSKCLDPQDGMEFESKEEAFSFYKEYAKSMGFAAIIKASRRSRISGKFIDAKFACTRYGSMRESCTAETLEGIPNKDCAIIFPVKKKRGRINRSWAKTDCKACMHVKRKQDGIWIVFSIIKEHNHDVFPDQAYHFQVNRKLDVGFSGDDTLHAIWPRTKKICVKSSKKSGDYTKVDNQGSSMSNQLRGEQHLALDEGDAQVILDHFIYMLDENPNFFYAIDLNEVQQLRNIFWIDAKGRLDYCSFSDVVFFDLTYIKNEYKLPFAPFIGVNHHCQYILLGCGLLADDTKSTYSWLMRAWLKAMGGRAPSVILTDQDEVLKDAIAEVFPSSRHCFCLWHIMNKVHEKLVYVVRQHEEFKAKFNKCIYESWTNDQFEKRWWKMVDRFNLRNDLWLQSLYKDRERWVPTYMKNVFLAGMSTIHRSESINCFLDKFMQRKTTVKVFIEHYREIILDKFEEEAKADFGTLHKQPVLKSPSPFEKQMAAIYTPSIFKKFQMEVLGAVACHPRQETEEGTTKTYKVQDFESNNTFIVEWNETTLDISCLCRSFEFSGFLCRHVMIVLQMSSIPNIPSQYILKRWTKGAKSRETLRGGLDIVESRVQRYNDLCLGAFKLSDEGSLSHESYNIAFRSLEEALRKCESLNYVIHNVIETSSTLGLAPQSLQKINPCNSNSMTNKKNSAPMKGQVHSGTEVINVGVHDGWQEMGHSYFQLPVLHCSHESQEEQLILRAPTLDGYFGTEQTVDRMATRPPKGRGPCSSNIKLFQLVLISRIVCMTGYRHACCGGNDISPTIEEEKKLYNLFLKSLLLKDDWDERNGTEFRTVTSIYIQRPITKEKLTGFITQLLKDIHKQGQVCTSGKSSLVLYSSFLKKSCLFNFKQLQM